MPNALSRLPVEFPGEDMDSNQKDIEVAFVLLMLTTLCTIEEQESNPQNKVSKLYSQEELVLIQ